MGANLCSGFHLLNKLDSNKVDTTTKEQLPTLFKRLDRISHQKDSQLDHTKSWVDQSRQHFREELDCTLCSDKKVDRRGNETPMAWMEDTTDRISEEEIPIKRAFPSNEDKSDNRIEKIDIKPNNVSKERFNEIGNHVKASRHGIDSNSGNQSENELSLMRNRSITSCGQRLDSSLESICGSIDGTTSPENNSLGNCNRMSHKTEIHYSTSERHEEPKDLIEKFSENLMLNKYKMTTNFDEKCSFCDIVAKGCHHDWNELDKDVVKLMETVDKLSALLSQKQLTFNKGPIDLAKNQNENKLKEKMIKLRKIIELHKIGVGKKLMVFTDGENTYQIQSKTSLLLSFFIDYRH